MRSMRESAKFEPDFVYGWSRIGQADISTSHAIPQPLFACHWNELLIGSTLSKLIHTNLHGSGSWTWFLLASVLASRSR
jgi:hypothetical protein